MSTDHSSSIEARARRLASKVDHQGLHHHAEMLEEEGRRSAVVFRRAIEIQLEARALESSLTLTHLLGERSYSMRPDGRLPSDGIGLELS